MASDWSTIRALRDAQWKGGKDEPAEARRLLARLDRPPPSGVPEGEIPDLIRSFLKAVGIDAQKTIPPGIANETTLEKAVEKVRSAGGTGLAKAAEDLGSLNPKGVDSNANGQGMIPEPHTVGPRPAFAVHGGNIRHERPFAGAAGDGSRVNAYKLLTYTFYDDQGHLRQVIEELADPQSAVRRTLVDLGIPDEELAEAAEVHRQHLAAGSDRKGPNNRHKQIQFPLPDGGYHAITPIPNASLHREIMDRTHQRRAEEEQADGTRRYDRFPQRDWAVGGTKPQNAGLLASWTAAMPSLFAEPPSPARGTDPDILREVNRFGTLFPAFLTRRLRRTGAMERLRKAQEAVSANLNIHTRNARERAAREIAREALSLADRFRWLAGTELAQGLAELPAHERSLFEGRLAELEPEERPEMAEAEEGRAAVTERILALIKEAPELSYDQALETDLREAIRREMEVLG